MSMLSQKSCQRIAHRPKTASSALTTRVSKFSVVRVERPTRVLTTMKELRASIAVLTSHRKALFSNLWALSKQSKPLNCLSLKNSYWVGAAASSILLWRKIAWVTSTTFSSFSLIASLRSAWCSIEHSNYKNHRSISRYYLMKNRSWPRKLIQQVSTIIA